MSPAEDSSTIFSLNEVNRSTFTTNNSLPTSTAVAIISITITIIIFCVISVIVVFCRNRSLPMSRDKEMRLPSSYAAREAFKTKPSVSITIPRAIHHDKASPRSNLPLSSPVYHTINSPISRLSPSFASQSRFVEHVTCHGQVASPVEDPCSTLHDSPKSIAGINESSKQSKENRSPGSSYIHLLSPGLTSDSGHCSYSHDQSSSSFACNGSSMFVTSTPRISYRWKCAGSPIGFASPHSHIFSAARRNSSQCYSNSASPELSYSTSMCMPDYSMSEYSTTLDTSNVGGIKVDDHLNDLTDLTYYSIDPLSKDIPHQDDWDFRQVSKGSVSQHHISTKRSDILTNNTVVRLCDQETLAQMEQGESRTRDGTKLRSENVSRESVANPPLVSGREACIQLDRSWEQEIVEVEHWIRAHQMYGAERRWM